MTIPPHVVSGQPIAASWGNAVVDELARQDGVDGTLNTKIDNNWGAQNNWNVTTTNNINFLSSQASHFNINGQLRGGQGLVQGGGGTYTTDVNGAFLVYYGTGYPAGTPVSVVVNNIVQSFPVIAQAFDIRTDLFQVMCRWLTPNAPGEPFANSAISIAWMSVGFRV